MDNTNTNKGLTFLEKIIILALDDKGWFGNSENSIKFGLAGAILFELFKHNRIVLKEGAVVVNDPSPLNDPLLDRVLGFIRSVKKNRSIRNWIQRMVFKKMMIRKSILRSLIDRRIIRKEEYSFFWVMFQYKYPIINSELKNLLREYRDCESAEARLVHDADQLDLIVELKEQNDLGNSYAVKWIHFARQRLITSIAQEIAEEILGTDSTDWWFKGHDAWWGKTRSARSKK